MGTPVLLTAEDILKHHGIKGMHWGVRKAGSVETSSGSGHKSGGESKSDSEDVKNVDKAKSTIEKSGTRALSNKDLQDVITRMNLEQQYSKLTEDKSALESGHAQTKKILDLIGTAQRIHGVVKSPLAKDTAETAKRVQKTVKIYKRARKIAKIAKDAAAVASIVAL